MIHLIKNYSKNGTIFKGQKIKLMLTFENG